jgi:hypothetical protein
MGTSLEETVLPTDSIYTLERSFPAPGTVPLLFHAPPAFTAVVQCQREGGLAD